MCFGKKEKAIFVLLLVWGNGCPYHQSDGAGGGITFSSPENDGNVDVKFLVRKPQKSQLATYGQYLLQNFELARGNTYFFHM